MMMSIKNQGHCVCRTWSNKLYRKYFHVYQELESAMKVYFLVQIMQNFLEFRYRLNNLLLNRNISKCELCALSIPDLQSISWSATLFHAQLSLRHFRGFLSSEAAIFVLCCYYDCYFCERFDTYKQFEHLLQKKLSISMDVKWRSMMTWMMNDKNVVEWLCTANWLRRNLLSLNPRVKITLNRNQIVC